MQPLQTRQPMQSQQSPQSRFPSLTTASVRVASPTILPATTRPTFLSTLFATIAASLLALTITGCDDLSDWIYSDRDDSNHSQNAQTPPPISLSQTSAKLWSGKTLPLTETHANSVVWNSDAPAIATVDPNGKVTAKGAGDATIKACSVDYPTNCASAAIKVVSIVQIAAGANHSALLNSEGDIYVAGQNANGQLGLGSQTLQTTFVKITVPNLLAAKTLKIALGDNHTLALAAGGGG